MDRDFGAVYVQTNDGDRNELVAFQRADDGRLERAGVVPTGGRGSGKPHLPSQGSVAVRNGWVLVTNAGSDDVSVFTAHGGEVTLVDRVASGGSAPTSVTVHGNLAYVLNTGGEPNVTGFRIGEDSHLITQPNNSQPIGTASDPAQVAVSPDGRALIVTDR